MYISVYKSQPSPGTSCGTSPPQPRPHLRPRDIVLRGPTCSTFAGGVSRRPPPPPPHASCAPAPPARPTGPGQHICAATRDTDPRPGHSRRPLGQGASWRQLLRIFEANGSGVEIQEDVSRRPFAESCKLLNDSTLPRSEKSFIKAPVKETEMYTKMESEE
ncbi:uncharacterized protein LOC134777300 [Penaeus indicus]|uniref:uncharacterized protein LOC134777300 n=1 Tax=Penaeus indicus TaxID=29960 RepID=UPI00300C2FA7